MAVGGLNGDVGGFTPDALAGLVGAVSVMEHRDALMSRALAASNWGAGEAAGRSAAHPGRSSTSDVDFGAEPAPQNERDLEHNPSADVYFPPEVAVVNSEAALANRQAILGEASGRPSRRGSGRGPTRARHPAASRNRAARSSRRTAAGCTS